LSLPQAPDTDEDGTDDQATEHGHQQHDPRHGEHAEHDVETDVARRFGLPIRFVGVGEEIDDFGPFQAEAFVEGLLRPATGGAP